MAGLHFACTLCGRCCHDLRLTLSLAEARTWAANGHRVELLGEALPWPDDPVSPLDPERQWQHDTSFAAEIGGLPFRVRLTPVANHAGPCPHLRPDMTCGQYEARPRICRIYPLESRPFGTVDPARRKCPPEAWQAGDVLTTPDGGIADGEAAAIVAAHRKAMVDDTPAKARLAGLLPAVHLAFAGEGLAITAPPPADLAAAIDTALGESSTPAPLFEIVSGLAETRRLLASAGCPVREAAPGELLSSFAGAAG